MEAGQKKKVTPARPAALELTVTTKGAFSCWGASRLLDKRPARAPVNQLPGSSRDALGEHPWWMEGHWTALTRQ
jgi:hypothetical protein